MGFILEIQLSFTALMIMAGQDQNLCGENIDVEKLAEIRMWTESEMMNVSNRFTGVPNRSIIN